MIETMSCKHLNEFVQDAAGVEAYRAVHANLISPWTSAGLDRKARASICMFNAHSSANGTCQGRSSARLHACLHCIHVACVATTPGSSIYPSRSHHGQVGYNHRDIHSRESHHPLSVELGHGNVYCSGKTKKYKITWKNCRIIVRKYTLSLFRMIIMFFYFQQTPAATTMFTIQY